MSFPIPLARCCESGVGVIRSSIREVDQRIHTSSITIPYLFFQIKSHSVSKMSDLPVTCNCIGYHALRQHVTQLDANARNRAIEQTRNSLLNPSMFVF
jgi:hypothetical protein